jgi:hypothetical protein
LHAFMHGCDYSSFASQALQLLPKVMNHIVSVPSPANGELNGKQRFLDIMANIRARIPSAPLWTRLNPTARRLPFLMRLSMH